jgi:hypothetical protein
MIVELLIAGMLVSGDLPRPPAVVLFLDDRTAVPGPVVARAMTTVTEAFDALGVPLRWRNGRAKSADGAGAPILIQVILENTPAREARPVLAYCAPYAPAIRSIWIRYDRVRDLALYQPDLRPLFLARVLAHEIVHVLEGSDQHGDAGVMKAHWTAADSAKLCRRPLEFTPADVERIRLGIARSPRERQK